MPKDQLKKGIAATARGSAIRSDGTLSPPTSNANLPMDDSSQKKDVPMQAQAAALLKSFINYMSSMKMLVLVILCLQNSLFTVLRRYSQGVLREVYSKHEVLLVGEVIKMAFSAWMISKDLPADCPSLKERLRYLVETSKKMVCFRTSYYKKECIASLFVMMMMMMLIFLLSFCVVYACLHLWCHEHFIVRGTAKYRSWIIYRLCAVQNHDNGYFFCHFIETFLFLGSLACSILLDVWSPLVQRTHLGRSKQV